MSHLKDGKTFPTLNFLNYKSTRYLADQLKIVWINYIYSQISADKYCCSKQNRVYRKTKHRILTKQYTVFSISCIPFLYYYYLHLHLKNCFSKPWKIIFLFISESKLRNLIYLTDFKFAAGIVLDEKLEFVLNHIIDEKCKRKTWTFPW